MLTPVEKETIVKVFEPYSPIKIGIFGSTARNEETLSSDIDILYLFKKPVSLFVLAKLKNDLEKKLGKQIDLVSENALHSKIKKLIYEDLKLIYAA